MTYGTPSATSTLGSTCAGGAADGVPAPAKAGPETPPLSRAPATGSLEYYCKLTEDQIQRTVWQHLQRRAKGGLNQIGGIMAFHPKNGGIHQSSPRQRIVNSQMGVLPGIPDIILIYQAKTYWLELKTLKGKLSADQQSLAHIARCNGVITGVAFGLMEALAWLERHDLLIGKTI